MKFTIIYCVWNMTTKIKRIGTQADHGHEKCIMF